VTSACKYLYRIGWYHQLRLKFVWGAQTLTAAHAGTYLRFQCLFRYQDSIAICHESGSLNEFLHARRKWSPVQPIFIAATIDFCHYQLQSTVSFLDLHRCFLDDTINVTGVCDAMQKKNESLTCDRRVTTGFDEFLTAIMLWKWGPSVAQNTFASKSVRNRANCCSISDMTRGIFCS